MRRWTRPKQFSWPKSVRARRACGWGLYARAVLWILGGVPPGLFHLLGLPLNILPNSWRGVGVLVIWIVTFWFITLLSFKFEPLRNHANQTWPLRPFATLGTAH
jgi:hypothetical protein